MNGTNCEQFSTRCEEHDCKRENTCFSAARGFFGTNSNYTRAHFTTERKMRFRLDFHDYLIVIQGGGSLTQILSHEQLRSVSFVEWIIWAFAKKRLGGRFFPLHFLLHTNRFLFNERNQLQHDSINDCISTIIRYCFPSILSLSHSLALVPWLLN